jgi:hypothetical protein
MEQVVSIDQRDEQVELIALIAIRRSLGGAAALGSCRTPEGLRCPLFKCRGTA